MIKINVNFNFIEQLILINFNCSYKIKQLNFLSTIYYLNNLEIRT